MYPCSCIAYSSGKSVILTVIGNRSPHYVLYFAAGAVPMAAQFIKLAQCGCRLTASVSVTVLVCYLKLCTYHIMQLLRGVMHAMVSWLQPRTETMLIS